jgi:hypothetical protein
MEVISFMTRLLYSRRYRPRNPLARRLSGPQSRGGHYGEEINFAIVGYRFPDRPARNQSLY